MNGIIVVNKEKDYTSRDIVNILNKEFNTKKIGHTGTLDPIATGVLVICIGKYTKLVDKITCYDKEYIATIKLGIKTDTLDITGNVIERDDNTSVDKNVLINTLNSFLGKSMQEVPSYSAVKINGKKLYEYARNSEEVELPKREINISEIELIDVNNDEITFRVVVSKGTYIRSLIRDICSSLGVLGTMSSLKRTRQGMFNINESYSLEDIKNNNFKLKTVEDIFLYPHYKLNDEEYFKVSNGVPLKINSFDSYLMLEYEGKVIAIYKNCDGVFKSYFRLI
jgi:tRNA pseudouridine55 synthase